MKNSKGAVTDMIFMYGHSLHVNHVVVHPDYEG